MVEFLFVGQNEANTGFFGGLLRCSGLVTGWWCALVPVDSLARSYYWSPVVHQGLPVISYQGDVRLGRWSTGDGFHSMYGGIAGAIV
jgi:hypothetical protein